jgi:hypothetical protein
VSVPASVCVFVYAHVCTLCMCYIYHVCLGISLAGGREVDGGGKYWRTCCGVKDLSNASSDSCVTASQKYTSARQTLKSSFGVIFFWNANIIVCSGSRIMKIEICQSSVNEVDVDL